MLQTMVPGKDIEDVEIMKHRYDGFDKEMNANASRVAVVNQLARRLINANTRTRRKSQSKTRLIRSCASRLRANAMTSNRPTACRPSTLSAARQSPGSRTRSESSPKPTASRWTSRES
uniref:Spectrin beta chain n=1 Tax=Culex pipiens TaxID=7175 RepID=A0A8D8AVM2_CULPI